MTIEPCRILLVDDTPDDLEITELQLRRTLIANSIETCETGEAALARVCDKSRPRIDLMLLDSSLPGMSGREATAALRQDPDLDHLHIVLVSAVRPRWVDECTPEEAPHAVLEKPVRLELLLRVLRGVGSYQLFLARNP